MSRRARGQNGGPLQGNFRHKAHLLFTWVGALVHHPKILDAAEDVLGPNILCWTTNFFIKEANSPGFVSWHQDAFYWGLNKDTVMTAWVALAPANLKNGCMKFLPGSQTQDHLQHVDTFDKDDLLSRGQEIENGKASWKAQARPMPSWPRADSVRPSNSPTLPTRIRQTHAHVPKINGHARLGIRNPGEMTGLWGERESLDGGIKNGPGSNSTAIRPLAIRMIGRCELELGADADLKGPQSFD